MPHLDSKTWIPDINRELGRFLSIRNSYLQIMPNSSNAPLSYGEWTNYGIFVKKGDQEANLRQPKLKFEPRVSAEDKQTLKPAFAGKSFSDHRSSVLAMETIWLPSAEFHPAKSVALWPCRKELNCEGTLRSLSGYSRFFPLPRLPSNETVHWKKKALIAPYPFDILGLPSLEPIDVEAETDIMMVSFIGEAMLRELDA